MNEIKTKIKMKDVDFECEVTPFFDEEYEYQEFLVKFEGKTIAFGHTYEEAVDDAHSYFFQLGYEYN